MQGQVDRLLAKGISENLVLRDITLSGFMTMERLIRFIVQQIRNGGKTKHNLRENGHGLKNKRGEHKGINGEASPVRIFRWRHKKPATESLSCGHLGKPLLFHERRTEQRYLPIQQRIPPHKLSVCVH